MNDDYLWDRTGAADPEVQELEEIMGTLRYQPKPLVLSAHIQRRRSFVPALAIAASILLMLLATGLWLSLRHSVSREKLEASKSGGEQRRIDNPTPSPQPLKDNLARDESNHTSGNLIPYHQRIQRMSSRASLALRQRRQTERDEALKAKEQLMVALRLTSAKLNIAQRRTQSAPPPNIIRNQHKLG